MIPVLVLGLFTILGIIFFIIGICLSNNVKKKYKQCNALTTAIVRKNIHENGTEFNMSSSDLMHPIFEYYVDEEKIEIEYAMGTSKIKYKEGQSVNIRYNPKKPTMFYVEGDKTQSLLGKVFITIGIACVFTAVVSCIIVTLAVNEIL